MNGIKIILVDDDIEYLKSLAQILSSEGANVLCFSNGTEAVNRLAEKGADLLITDLEMPAMNGLELSRKAKEIRPSIPILMITAVSETIIDGLQEMADGIGIARILSKSSDIETILNLIKQHSMSSDGSPPKSTIYFR